MLIINPAVTELSNTTDYLSLYKAIATQTYISNVQNTPSIIELPTTLIAYHHYYDRVDSSFYTGSYQYHNNVLIFDHRKSRGNFISLKNKNYWMKSFHSLNKNTFIRGDEWLVKERNLDWSESKLNHLKIKDFLLLDMRGSRDVFKAYRPKIVLDYSFKQISKISFYDGYWEEDQGFKRSNLYTRVNYGYLKPKPNSRTYIYGSIDTKTIPQLFSTEHNAPVSEGYDSISLDIDIKYKNSEYWNYDYKYLTNIFSQTYIEKNWWDRFTLNAQLGEPQPIPGLSKELTASGPQSNMRFIDFDDIFTLSPKTLDEGKVSFSIDIDWQKIHNIDHFLLSASLLKFSLNLDPTTNPQKIEFDLGDVLHQTFEMSLDDYMSLFRSQDKTLSVTSGHDGVTLVDEGAKDYVYNLKILAIQGVNNEIKINKTFFSTIYPSELLQEDVLQKLFIWTGFEEMNISKYMLSFCNVHLKPDDIKGEATLTYTDFASGKRITLTIVGFKFLTHIPTTFKGHGLHRNYLDLLHVLLQPYGVGAHFWQHVTFMSAANNVMNTTSRYKLKFNFPSKEITDQWNNFYKDQTIIIFHDRDLSLIQTKKTLEVSADQYTNHSIKRDLFEVSDNAREAGLIMDNYDVFSHVTPSGDLTVSVVLDDAFQGNKTYSFNSPQKSIQKISSTSSDGWYVHGDNWYQWAFMTFLGIVSGSVGLCGVINFLKRRKGWLIAE